MSATALRPQPNHARGLGVVQAGDARQQAPAIERLEPGLQVGAAWRAAGRDRGSRRNPRRKGEDIAQLLLRRDEKREPIEKASTPRPNSSRRSQLARTGNERWFNPISIVRWLPARRRLLESDRDHADFEPSRRGPECRGESERPAHPGRGRGLEHGGETTPTARTSSLEIPESADRRVDRQAVHGRQRPELLPFQFSIRSCPAEEPTA